MSRKWKVRDNERTQRLSLAELAAHDDVCSDALVDNVGPLRSNPPSSLPECSPFY